MLKRLPQLTRFYGITPRDIDDMTYGEVSEYLVQMEQALREREVSDGR